MSRIGSLWAGVLYLRYNFWKWSFTACLFEPGLLWFHLCEVWSWGMHLLQPRWQGWGSWAVPHVLHEEKWVTVHESKYTITVVILRLSSMINNISNGFMVCCVFLSLNDFVSVSISKITPSHSALSGPKLLQQHWLREMGHILQQDDHNAAAWLTLQWL